MTLTFRISGEPKPQPRPRAFARNMGGGKFAARVYDAGTAEGWKSCVAIAAKPFLPSEPLSGPLAITVEFFMSRPKGHCTPRGALRASAPQFPTSRNDVDNMLKAILDALTQIGMWEDDGQIVNATVTKRYAVTPRCVGASVRIEEVGEG